jgi:hypothetical protein
MSDKLIKRERKGSERNGDEKGNGEKIPPPGAYEGKY